MSGGLLQRIDALGLGRVDNEVTAARLVGALWLAVAAGDLEPIAVGRGAWFVPTLQAQRRVRAQLMTVRADEAALIYRVGETWASRSTARKNWPTAVAEAGKRASSFA